MESIKRAASAAKNFVLKHKAPIGALVAFIIIVALLWSGAFGLAAYLKSRSGAKSGFLDYMPDVSVPCPSDYRCGGISREQVAMEKNLFTDLRESSKYAQPETMTTDAYDVIATEAEPTSCMLKRAENGREMPMPEGQYTPWEEIESGFFARKNKHLKIS